MRRGKIELTARRGNRVIVRHAGALLRTLLGGALLCWLPSSFVLAMTGLSGGSEVIPYSEQAGSFEEAPAAATATASMTEVLDRRDVALYRRIFALQEEGRWEEADKLIARLTNPILLGHVQHQRYMHPTAYVSSFSELAAWLEEHADHPGAESVYSLALQRKPAEAPAPRKPERRGEFRVDFTFYEIASESRGVDDLLQEVAATSNDFGQGDIAALQGFTLGRGTSGSWIMPGDRQKAEEIESRASELVARAAPSTNWNKGLSAWREGDITSAAAHFQAVVLDEGSSPAQRSAAAYWAARASLRLGQPQEMSRWLREALVSPRSFYGLLAQQALGAPPQLSFETPAYDPAALKRLLARPEITRIAALLQVGEIERASKELEALGGVYDFSEAEALLTLIDGAKLAARAFNLASRMEQVVGNDGGIGTLDVGLFPLPPWEPAEGFKVDRALLYALMRQESAFNPAARSPMGASGLMQIMPQTASYVAGDKSLSGANRHLLLDPAFNLEIAQRYVLYLLEGPDVQGNLLHMAAAYNAGPGNLQRWLRKMKAEGMDPDDPLLFIESLPSSETRNFVRQVLKNFWMYRIRLGQPVPSLEQLAAGEWPQYESLE